MLDIDVYCGYDNVASILDLTTITVIETTSEPDATGHLVAIRDCSGNLHWGFKGSSSDGDRWLRVGTLDQASRDFDFFRDSCQRVMEMDFGPTSVHTNAAYMGCPID